MRVPFLVRWPSRIEPRHDPLLLSTPDIYPTLLDLMGYAADVPQSVQGVSHATLFLSGKGQRPASQLYMWVPVGQPAWGRRGLRTDRHTFVITKNPGASEEVVLHDNQADPYQLENVARDRPEVVRRLTEELERRLRRSDDPWLQS